MAKSIRAEDIRNSEFAFLERDSCDNMANYTCRLPDGNIAVKTLYRFGKPALMELSPDKFDEWRKSLDNVSEI